jgi:potassium/hydrogen antiporter
MIQALLLAGTVLLICVLSSKLLYRFGIPTLLIFLTLGMLLGSDGIGGIYFDNSILTQQISSIGLVFIMFYGGFGFNWKAAKPVAVQSILLSTVGVALTAFLVGLFSHFILKVTFLEGMLLGAIVSSTDAASVFSILRSKNLNLKGGLASMLEMESGSNDPVAYMLTIVVLSMMTNNKQQSILQLLSKQVIFGLVIGFALAAVSIFILRRIRFEIDGLHPIFIIAVVLLGYSLAEWIGGNGFLSVYIIGIIMGNNRIPHKKSMVQFFDGLSWLMQIVLFFTLGLLVFPSQLPTVFVSGLAIAIFMVVIARPVAVMSILSWFKTPLKYQIFVSWVGLRGAASIVFATYAMTNNLDIANDIFNTVFFIALFSVIIQGTMIPQVANRLDLVEKDSSVYKTFNDYEDEVHTKLIEFHIKSDSPWADKTIMDANIPEEILVVMIKRKGEIITPKGSSFIKAGDTLVLSANNFDEINKFFS